VRVGLLAAALSLAACGPKAPASTSATASERALASEQDRKLPGEYTCSFAVSDEELGDARCAISRGGGGLELDASGAAELLRGILIATDYGFKFEGEYTCAAGDSCREEARTDFFETEGGLYTGVIELLEAGRILTVTLRRAP
jgi:hypothetical protein